jgi:hypothetical protein
VKDQKEKLLVATKTDKENSQNDEKKGAIRV